MHEPTESSSTSTDYKYWAFISYSHQDKKWGDWLHKTLETYRVPRRLAGQSGRDGVVPKRAYPVFRDREELPGSSDLGNNINEALRKSRYLIVICSPRSAKSQWVNEEIKAFKAMGREDRVLCLIVDGEPNAADKPDTGAEECFPAAVKFRTNQAGQLSNERTEPIAADARAGKDGKANARLKLLAGILGIEYDALKQRDRRRIMFRRVASATIALLVAGICLFGLKLQQQKEWEKLRAESLHLAAVSTAQTEAGNSETGILLALKALPTQRLEPNRPYVREAEVALARAINSHRQLAVYHDVAAIESVAFAPNGQKFLSVSNNSVGVWDKKTGNMLCEFMDLVQPKARFSADSSTVIISCVENGQPNLILLDSTTGATLTSRTLGETSYIDALLSPDGQYAITCCAENAPSDQNSFAVFFWPTTPDDQPPVILSGLPAPVTGIVFSADGSRFMLLDSAHSHADIWQRQGDRFSHLHTINQALAAAAFNSTGEKVALAPKDGGFEIYDIASATITSEGADKQKLGSLIFTPNDRALLAGAAWNSTEIFDVSTSTEIGSFVGKNVVFSPDGSRMAAVAQQGNCALYDLDTMQQYAVLVGHKQDINAVCFSPVDSNLLLSASDDNTIRLWSTAFDRKQIFSAQGDKNLHLAYSADGTKFATLSSSGTVRVWDGLSGKELLLFGDAPDKEYEDMALLFAAEDNTIVTSLSKGFGNIGEKFPLTIRWWNSHSGELLLEQREQNPWVQQPILSHDRQLALTIGLDNIVRIVDCATAQVIHELAGHSATIVHASFNLNGTKALTSSNDGTIRLWNVADSKEILQVKQIDKWGEAVGSFAIFSPEGQTFAAINDRTKTIQIFDCATGKLLRTLDSPDEAENSLKFSPDSKYLLSMPEVFATNIHLWEVASGKLIAVLPGSMLSYTKTLFSPDGKLLLCWNNDAQGPTVWSIPAGQRITQLKLPDSSAYLSTVKDVKISPDGQMIAVSYATIGALWDRQTMALIRELRGHEDIDSMLFNPNGATLLSAGSEGTIQAWETQPSFEELRDRGLSLVSRELSMEECTQLGGNSDK